MGNAGEDKSSHKNLAQHASGVIASIALKNAGSKIAGTLVTPAVWALNYASDKSTPDVVDVGLFASGFLAAPASIVTGAIKAIVDDDIDNKLDAVRNMEMAKYRPFIKTCESYSFSAPGINAQTIASMGGSAWQSHNGLWCYIVDARGRLVADFIPASYVLLYRPVQPLKKSPAGRFVWESLRK